MSLFNELKRRNVIRVAMAYVVAAWLITEIASFLLEQAAAPWWSIPLLAVVFVVGFPVAVVLAWVFDLTLKGVERTPSVGDGAEVTPAGFSARFTRQLVISGAVVILAMTGVGWRYMPNDSVDFEANRVAVASFTNETGNPDLDVLGSVVARALSRELEQLQGLVIDLGETPPGGPRDATQSSTEFISAVHALAERTKARLVVGGSYLPRGDELLLMVEVYDAEQQERVFIGEPILTDPMDPMAAVLQAKENLFGFMASMGDIVAMVERSTVLPVS